MDSRFHLIRLADSVISRPRPIPDAVGHKPIKNCESISRQTQPSSTAVMVARMNVVMTGAARLGSPRQHSHRCKDAPIIPRSPDNKPAP
eukprot:3299204-Pyramimonas_sp.AAC.1